MRSNDARHYLPLRERLTITTFENRKNYVFESDCLQILYVPIIIEAARWFQNSNIFHFLKAVPYENHSERQIFTANHRIERHPGHQNHHRDTPLRQVQIDAGLY